MPVYAKKKTTELIEKKVIAKTIPRKKNLVEQHVQAGVIVSFPSYQVSTKSQLEVKLSKIPRLFVCF